MAKQNVNPRTILDSLRAYILSSPYQERTELTEELESSYDLTIESLTQDEKEFVDIDQIKLSQQPPNQSAAYLNAEFPRPRSFENYRHDTESLALLLTIYNVMIIPSQISNASIEILNKYEIPSVSINGSSTSASNPERFDVSAFEKLGKGLFPNEFDINDFK